MKKIILAGGAIAGALAAILGLYLSLVRIESVNMTLIELEDENLSTALIGLQFSNEGNVTVSVNEVELFFTDNQDCTGKMLSRVIVGTSDDRLPIAIEPGNQSEFVQTSDLMLEDETRYALCATVETFTGIETYRNEKIVLVEFSVMWNEFDRDDLERETISLIHERSLRNF